MVTLNRNEVVTLNWKTVVNITEFYSKYGSTSETIRLIRLTLASDKTCTKKRPLKNNHLIFPIDQA